MAGMRRIVVCAESLDQAIYKIILEETLRHMSNWWRANAKT